MAILPVLERGFWIEDLDDGVGRQVEALCHVLSTSIMDAALALLMFEHAYAASHEAAFDKGRWERDRELERQRRDQLEASAPHIEGEWMGDRMTRIYEQARRDLVQAKWNSGEIPNQYTRRLPFVHARTFLVSLAQMARGLRAMAKLDLRDAKQPVVKARDDFEAAQPSLKHVRDSIEHAEDRMRGLGRGEEPLTLAPIMNSMIHAPGGGVIAGDSLNKRHFGCTVESGGYAEVEVTDDTLKQAHAAVQDVFDALPWKPGHRQSEPSD